MKKLRPQVVVAGHICLDITPTFIKSNKNSLDEIFIPGKLINVGRINISPGGPVSNTGIALSILGINVELMGKVGRDYFGECILNILKPRGLHKGMIITEGEETSYTVVIVPPGLDRIFFHNPGANDTFCADDINYELVGKAKIFHFGYPPLMKRFYSDGGEELAQVFRKVKSLGVTTSLDMSLPDASSQSGKVNWDAILRRVLPYVDIYIPSAEETLFMLRKDIYEELGRVSKGRDMIECLDINLLQELGNKLLSYGTGMAVIKCGIKGYYIRTGDRKRLNDFGKAIPSPIDNWSERELLEESFYVPDAISATGSGDSSIAGFLAALLGKKSIEESIRIACAVGAQNVRALDAISGIRTWEETMEMVKGPFKKNRLDIHGNYWVYDSDRGLWKGQKDKSCK
ncbi:MAG: carbohydrate kinase family protein [Clostridiaceae bacterium]|nr:carbohydrate kinase family protein [Clostridiaceae bacterium]